MRLKNVVVETMNKLYIKSIVISMIFLLCQNLVSATTITIPKVWATNDTLTAADLNSGFSTIFNDYNGSINPSNFATTLTFTSTQYLDLSAIVSSTTKGLRLPTGTTGGTNNGQIAWDATAKALRTGDGTNANFTPQVATQGTVGQVLSSGGANALATWASPSVARVVLTSGDLTTTSASLVDVTGATSTITTGAFPCWYALTGTLQHSSTNNITLNVAVDGTLEVGTSGELDGGTTFSRLTGLSGQTAVLTAASHTIKAQWATSGGTATMLANSSQSLLWAVHEIR